MMPVSVFGAGSRPWMLVCVVVSILTTTCVRAHPRPAEEGRDGSTPFDAGFDATTGQAGFEAGLEAGCLDATADGRTDAKSNGADSNETGWNDVDGSSVAPAFRPQNVILVLGDGMGLAQVNAGRIFRGGKLHADELNGPALCNTASLSGSPDAGIETTTDSAAAMTAIATGKRTHNGVLSLDPSGKWLPTVLETYAAQGKSAGLITTSYVLDASPMGLATHVASRYQYTDMADQLFMQTRLEIVMGGWMPNFGDNDTAMAQLAISRGYKIISTAEELATQYPPWPSKVLGLFRVETTPDIWPEWSSGMTPVALREQSNQEPTLAEMTLYALDRLAKNPNGFFLFVEDELIDSIGESSGSDHDLAIRMLPPEVAALDDALGVALKWVRDHSSLEQTLVVLTGDHETGGYTLNGNDLSLAKYTTSVHTLRPVPVYAAGPGSSYVGSISHLTDIYCLLSGTLSAKSGSN
jgi:alkaline phosphatase